VKLLQEVLGGMKVIKFFAWEVPFLEKISQYRRREVEYVYFILLQKYARTDTPFQATFAQCYYSGLSTVRSG